MHLYLDNNRFFLMHEQEKNRMFGKPKSTIQTNFISKLKKIKIKFLIGGEIGVAGSAKSKEKLLHGAHSMVYVEVT